jgi:hypothetical protein
VSGRRPAVYRPEPEAEPDAVHLVVHLVVTVDAGDPDALDASVAAVVRQLRRIATVVGTEVPLPGMHPQ